VLQGFKTYPNNASKAVVEKIINWLLHIFKNYKEALLLLEKKSPENKLAYQSYFYRV
jgi:hypothetical protein